MEPLITVVVLIFDQVLLVHAPMLYSIVPKNHHKLYTANFYKSTRIESLRFHKSTKMDKKSCE